MLTVDSNRTIAHAREIAYVSADEAYHLMIKELERFVALLETLDPDDWEKPTACTGWSVRDILAHQAGGYESGTGYRAMFRQLSSRPKAGQLIEDAVNARQLADRAGRSPAELMEELRQVGPLGSRKWAYEFRLAKLFSLPHPVPGWLSLRHLMWVIHSRDTWMHRLDICRATGRHFEQTADHDGRIAELVILDVGKQLSQKLGGSGMVLNLSGTAGGAWQVGRAEPAAEVQMDALDFNILASGRYSYEEARSRAFIDGDVNLAENALRNLLILY
jgi:uncharacterized protein (TIGR03083 family)